MVQARERLSGLPEMSWCFILSKLCCSVAQFDFVLEGHRNRSGGSLPQTDETTTGNAAPPTHYYHI